MLPAAIEQDLIIALLPRSEPQVRIANVLPRYKSAAFSLTPPTSDEGEWHVDFVAPKDGGGWDNYLKVALAEGLSKFFKRGEGSPRGMDLLVSGVVPPGSGLSVSCSFAFG